MLATLAQFIVDGFLHSSRMPQCQSALLKLENLSLRIHVGQPEPGDVDLDSFITITIQLNHMKLLPPTKNDVEHLTPAEA